MNIITKEFRPREDGPFDPVALDAALRRLFGEALGVSAETTVAKDEPIQVHTTTLETMIRGDLVDWIRDGDILVPTYMGLAVARDDRLLPVADVAEAQEVLQALLAAQAPEAPACDCPEGVCAGAAGEPVTSESATKLDERISSIEGEAFEPYEIPVVDAQWSPAPSKREILAGIARSIENFSNASLELLEQVDLLRDDA